MKQIFLYILLLTGLVSQAQTGPGNKEEKIQALYVAYMTRDLSLTEEEAQKFWPVHAQYDNEITAIKNENEIERQQAILNVKKKYQDRFTKILGAERTNNFFIKDAEFRKKLIDRLKNLRQQNQNGLKPRQQQQLRRNAAGN